MYKLLILFVFFSLVAAAQTIPPVTNQNNSPEIQREKINELDVKSVKAIPINSQLEVFEMNVNHLQSELKSIALSPIRKTPTPIQQQQMENQLKEIKRINENSFQYHLLNYQVGNYDFSKIESLKEAAKIRPNDVSVLKEFSAYSYIMNDEEELRKYLNSLNSMRIFSMDLELFAVSLLHSLPKNTYLITHGESDTYPLLIQQKIKNIRKDVEIISLEHLQSMDYRNRLKKEGFRMPKSNVIGTDFFAEFMQLNKTKFIVVAPSVPRSYIEKGDKLNAVGFGYFLFDYKQTNANKTIYENELKSLISKHVDRGIKSDVISNYLPFLFEVRNQYIEKKDVRAIDEIEKLILRIAQLSNKETQVKALLNK